MKKIFFATFAVLAACAPRVTVEVTNPSDFDRGTEMVEIALSELGKELGKGGSWQVSADGQTVPSQVTHDGRLIFQSTLGAGESKTFTVRAAKGQEFAPKTRGRVAPERFNDFIWENDRVAFRIYQQDLVAVDGPSNGIDALYKRTPELILDTWYADATERNISYHEDNGTGLDDYKVGRTLGAGGAAPWVDERPILNSNYLAAEVLDNGPLRTTFRLTYPPLELPDGTTLAETRTFSIDAGSQMTRVEQSYSTATLLRVAVGFPLHADGAKFMSAGKTLMIAEPATAKASDVFLGVVLPTTIGETIEYNGGDVAAPHVLALTSVGPGTPLVYYTGFGWKRFGDWNGSRFAVYLGDFAAALETPLIIKINK